ncbi:hypothetical protein AD998_05065 [bacterium 336/3]|nr:hypothetical protein AD998_05065 [bacterium 336/3]
MIKKLLLLFFLFCFLSQSYSQGFDFKDHKKKYARIPFKLYNNLIIVPVLLNKGTDTLNFILDTGVGYTMITDSTFVDKLQIPPHTRKVGVKGGGVGEVIYTYIVGSQQMVLNDFIAKNLTVLITSKSLEYISQYVGIKIHGIIGFDFFRKLIVKINYQKKELEVYDIHFFDKKILKKNKTNNILKLYIQKQKPYFLAKFINENNDSINVKLLLDTGAGHSLSLDKESKKGITLPSKTIDNSLGLAINGLIEGKMGRVKSLGIGQYYWKDVLCSFPDSLLILHRNENVDKQGSIGIGLLERFVITLDYSNERFILEPNNKLNKKFDIGFSGVDVVSSPNNFTIYFVSNIHPLSPAYVSGLQIGDELFAINNQVLTNMTISQVYELLDSAENKVLNLLVKRRGALQIIVFKTKRLI